MKKGDSHAPLIFIMVMQLAAKCLEIEFKQHNVKLLDIYASPSMINVVLRKHRISDIGSMNLSIILILLYIDDGAIPFASQKDAVLGLKLCIKVFIRFGLIIHIGTKSKHSKTKGMFFP